jgi:hypothetical protein
MPTLKSRLQKQIKMHNRQTPKCRFQKTDSKKVDSKIRISKSPSRKYLWTSLKTARRQKPSIRKKRSPREKSARVVVLYKGNREWRSGPLGAVGEAVWLIFPLDLRRSLLAGKFCWRLSTSSSAYASAKLSAGSYESCVLLGCIQLSIGKGENSGNASSCAWWGSRLKQRDEERYWNSFCIAATSSV